MEVIKDIAATMQREIAWFETVVHAALSLYFQNEDQVQSVYEHQPPALENDTSLYAKLIQEHHLGFEERLLVILALIPKVRPQSLDVLLIKNQNLNSDFSEFGGIKDQSQPGFIPSLETACFILTGNSLEQRLQFMKILNKDHLLYHKGILDYNASESFGLKQPLQLSEEYFGYLTTGIRQLPEYNSKFPAKEIATELTWDDLVVEQSVSNNLLEIQTWLMHSEKILKNWGLERNLKKGYRVLFYGPPGTGKTLAATILGKETRRPVFRIDLSLVVSKYIGETEKNLGRLFDEAENKDWILFFDEADALFGKRTATKSSNDRYANQEVAYLLQRIEDFSGLVILATNLNTNIDEAFSRRFQSMIHFPKPGVNQRKKLWDKMFASNFELCEKVDLDDLSEKYELTGGEMINVLRYCALNAAKRDEKKIEYNDIISGIRREYKKSNKTI